MTLHFDCNPRWCSIIKVLGHQYQWLAGGYDMEIGGYLVDSVFFCPVLTTYRYTLSDTTYTLSDYSCRWMNNAAEVTWLEVRRSSSVTTHHSVSVKEDYGHTYHP